MQKVRVEVNDKYMGISGYLTIGKQTGKGLFFSACKITTFVAKPKILRSKNAKCGQKHKAPRRFLRDCLRIYTDVCKFVR